MYLKRFIWIALIPLAAYLYYQIRFLGSDAAHLSHYALQLVLLVFASLSMASASLREQRKDVSAYWGRLATGTALWALASIMESAEVLLAQPRFGTVADGAWISGYAVVLAALITGANSFQGWKSKRSLLAGGLWLFLSGAIVLLIVFDAMPSVDRTLVLLVGVVYHVGDIVLVFLAILCSLGDAPVDLQMSLKMMLVSFFLFYLFDLIVILQQITAPLDQWTGAGYAVGYFLMYRAGMKGAVNPT